MRAPLTLATAAVLLGAGLTAGPANATCKRFGFTVNDYGKEGPTKDAKELLDKHIAEWAAQQGIKEYKTGTKSVNCELFLNFVVFDEHTCTASANVCWNDGKGSSTPDATTDGAEAGIPPTPIRKAALLGHDKKPATADAKATPPAATETAPAAPATTEAAAATPPPAAPPAAAEPAPAPPAATEPAKAAETTPPPASPPPAVVETGTLPKEPDLPLNKHATATPDVTPTAPAKSAETVPEVPPAATPPVKPADLKPQFRADPAAASAAATAAAAAAERAALAAETAAAAAKEAAAAAVAASAASKGAVVPPLDAGP